MKRSIIGVLCLALLCAIASPAFAIETKLSGFYKLRAISDNFSARNNFIGNLTNDNKEDAVFDQRLRMKLSTKVNDFLSFVYYAEVDMQFGDESYSNSGRNDGGAIGGDTTNLETKNLYIDVKVPNTTSAFRLGLQGVADHYDYAFFAADMAGIKYTTTLGGTNVTAGYFNLSNGGNFQSSNNINLWLLQTNINANDNLKFGADYYYYQNQGAPAGNQPYASYFGTADIGAISGTSSNWSNTRSSMDLHYLGGHGEYKMNNLVLSGWVTGNFGSVDDLTINGGLMDVDVAGYATSVKASTTLGGVKLNVRGTYFSSDDDLSDGDADFLVNPLATESFAFASDGFMIMTPDTNWNSIGQYGFAMVDSAWAGYGLAAINLTGSFKPSTNTTIRAGVGYFSSLEDTLAANDPRTDRNGTTLGTEFFVRANYNMAENLDLSLNGAYASLGSFYDNNGGGQSANVATNDITDPFEVYAQVNLKF